MNASAIEEKLTLEFGDMVVVIQFSCGNYHTLETAGRILEICLSDVSGNISINSKHREVIELDDLSDEAVASIDIHADKTSPEEEVSQERVSPNSIKIHNLEPPTDIHIRLSPHTSSVITEEAFEQEHMPRPMTPRRSSSSMQQ